MREGVDDLLERRRLAVACGEQRIEPGETLDVEFLGAPREEHAIELELLIMDDDSRDGSVEAVAADQNQADRGLYTQTDSF